MITVIPLHNSAEPVVKMQITCAFSYVFVAQKILAVPTASIVLKYLLAL
jgi:hypothetical protein